MSILGLFSSRRLAGLFVLLVHLWLTSFVVVVGQGYQDDGYHYQGEDYQDYADGYQQQDNLYADYVERKEAPAGGGWGKTLAFGVASWFLGGKIHSKRAVAKANKKAGQERQELYTQYYKDVLALQTQNAELIKIIEETAKQQQDAEFSAADIDHDNKVSRAEFNRYKNQYLQLHPEMASQFPKFEDFDPDSNGLISKDEYDAYYRMFQQQHA